MFAHHLHAPFMNFVAKREYFNYKDEGVVTVNKEPRLIVNSRQCNEIAHAYCSSVF